MSDILSIVMLWNYEVMKNQRYNFLESKPLPVTVCGMSFRQPLGCTSLQRLTVTSHPLCSPFTFWRFNCRSPSLSTVERVARPFTFCPSPSTPSFNGRQFNLPPPSDRSRLLLLSTASCTSCHLLSVAGDPLFNCRQLYPVHFLCSTVASCTSCHLLSVAGDPLRSTVASCTSLHLLTVAGNPLFQLSPVLPPFKCLPSMSRPGIEPRNSPN